MTGFSKPKIAIAGAVNSSLKTFEKLLEHDCNVVAALTVNPEKSKFISGYQDLKLKAEVEKIPAVYFDNINDDEVYDFLRLKEVDFLFVVGLSQLVKKRMLNLPKHGTIGFHPTKLPQGRGRGAVAWIILEKAPGAATFFLIDEGMDSGPILCQKEFQISKDDYALEVIEKIKNSIDAVLDSFLPQLNNWQITPIEQTEKKATYLGRRKPKDGLINWKNDVEDIYRLIRASSKPLPGAFSFYNESKVTIYKAKIEEKNKYIGVPGRILKINDGKPLIAAGNGAIWLEDYDSEKNMTFKVEQDFNNNKK